MDADVNLNTREITFNDVAVKELAYGKAACICKVQFGRCDKSACRTCPTNRMFKNCVSQMSDYDKLRLQSNITEQYKQLSLYPQRYRRYESVLGHTIMAAVVCLMFLVLVIMCVGCKQKPSDLQGYDYVTEEYVGEILAEYIDAVIELTDAMIWDCNKDGVINCCDYAALFKHLFDKGNDFNSDLRCLIVWNYNPPKMNHLFIAILDTKSRAYIEVEPKLYEGKGWEMRKSWESYKYGMYDPAYNKYNTTERWYKEGGF